MSNTAAWPEHLVTRARAAVPVDAGVLSGSTPVVSFGDPRAARVATLGINPSWREFSTAAGQLPPADRRLVHRDDLRVGDGELTEEQGLSVLEGSAAYFRRRPYWQWFQPLDGVLLRGASASYVDGSACHLDLVQWATRPVWGALEPASRERLLDADAAFLQEQLRRSHLTTVLLAGRAVVEQVRLVMGVELAEVASLEHPKGGYPKQVTLFEGALDGGIQLLGWSCNLQSQHGASAYSFALGDWLGERLNAGNGDARDVEVMAADPMIAKGTSCGSKTELAVLLRAWLEDSDARVIAEDVSYGGQPWVHLDLPGGRLVLNADTRREAVETWLEDVAARGAEVPWRVVANTKGTVNKVVYAAEGVPAAGWYCYSRTALSAPGQV